MFLCSTHMIFTLNRIFFKFNAHLSLDFQLWSDEVGSFKLCISLPKIHHRMLSWREDRSFSALWHLAVNESWDESRDRTSQAVGRNTMQIRRGKGHKPFPFASLLSSEVTWGAAESNQLLLKGLHDLTLSIRSIYMINRESSGCWPLTCCFCVMGRWKQRPLLMGFLSNIHKNASIWCITDILCISFIGDFIPHPISVCCSCEP